MNQRKAKIGIFSFVVLNNILSGQQRRVYDLVVGLSKEFDVDYVEITDSDKLLTEANFINTEVNCINYKLGYTKFLKICVNLLHAILFPFFGIKKSLILGYIWSFRNRRLLRKSNFDVVICEYFMTSFIFNYLNSDSLKIIDMHDIQFVTLQSSLRGVFFKESKIFFAKKIEISMLKRADALIAVNTKEIEKLSRLGVKAKCFFVPMSVCDVKVKNELPVKQMSMINLSYFAGLSSQRSFEELDFILSNLLTPVFLKYGKEVKLFVFGNNPSKRIIDLCNRFENVELIGNIDDIANSFSRIHFSVNFWLGESYGFRTRVIDVLSCGVPILLNEKCIEGMGLGIFKSLIFIEEGNKIIEILDYYQNRPHEYELLCKDALYVSQLYSESVVSKRFNTELLEFIS